MLAQIAQAPSLVALGEPAPFLVDNEGNMEGAGVRKPQTMLQEALPSCAGQKVSPPHDFGDLIECVVANDRELIGGRAIFPQDREVADCLGDVHALNAEEFVFEYYLTVIHQKAELSVEAGLLFGVGSIPVSSAALALVQDFVLSSLGGAVLHAGELAARAHARIGQAASLERLSLSHELLPPTRFENDGSVPIEAQPS